MEKLDLREGFLKRLEEGLLSRGFVEETRETNKTAGEQTRRWDHPDTGLGLEVLGEGDLDGIGFETIQFYLYRNIQSMGLLVYYVDGPAEVFRIIDRTLLAYYSGPAR